MVRSNTASAMEIGGPIRLTRPGDAEILALTTLCALDMYTTLWWVLTGQAVEANPMLAWTFEMNPLVFVAVKAGTFLPALLLARHFAREHPKFSVFLLRAVLFAYVAIYLFAVK